jgi:hypothetical protein
VIDAAQSVAISVGPSFFIHSNERAIANHRGAMVYKFAKLELRWIFFVSVLKQFLSIFPIEDVRRISAIVRVDLRVHLVRPRMCEMMIISSQRGWTLSVQESSNEREGALELSKRYCDAMA